MLARILCWVSKSFYSQHWRNILFHVSKIKSTWPWCTFGYSDLMNIHGPLLEEAWKELNVQMKRITNVNWEYWVLLKFFFALHPCSLCHPAWYKPSQFVLSKLFRKNRSSFAFNRQESGILDHVVPAWKKRPNPRNIMYAVVKEEIKSPCRWPREASKNNNNSIRNPCCWLGQCSSCPKYLWRNTFQGIQQELHQPLWG